MIKLHNSIGKNFCYAPWTNIHINTEGQLKTCCAGTKGLTNVRQNPIDVALVSDELLDIKNKLLNNQPHSNCDQCIDREKMTDHSERDWYNDIADEQVIEITSIDQTHLQNLDIRWSNTCNLSCSYCGPDASSQWANLKKFPIQRMDYNKGLESVLNFISKNKHTVKNVGLLGGEPLLQKENEFLLDEIGEQTKINVITNLTVPLDSNKIFKKLLGKKYVKWDISFDTVEKRFEYVRHGASWEQILKNIKKLQDATKDTEHDVAIAAVYSVYNALNLKELHEYFLDHKLPQLGWNELVFPDILAVRNLPEHFRMIAADQCLNSIRFHSWDRQKNWLRDMSANLRAIKNDKNSCESLYQWHKHQEDTYWPNFKYRFEHLWPEYSI